MRGDFSDAEEKGFPVLAVAPTPSVNRVLQDRVRLDVSEFFPTATQSLDAPRTPSKLNLLECSCWGYPGKYLMTCAYFLQ
jgi:hypothetical protein